MRLISFFLALLIAGTVIIYPRVIASDMTDVPHGWLVLLLIGMSLSFVYGVGFKTKNRLLNLLFSPVVSWPCIAIGAYMIWSLGPLGR